MLQSERQAKVSIRVIMIGFLKIINGLHGGNILRYFTGFSLETPFMCEKEAKRPRWEELVSEEGYPESLASGFPPLELGNFLNSQICCYFNIQELLDFKGMWSPQEVMMQS